MINAVEIARLDGAVFFTGTRHFVFEEKKISSITGAEAFVFPVKQVHSNKTAVFPGEKPLDCDGIITEQRRIAIGVKTADCMPVSLYDPVRHIIAIFHCGWRGLHDGILQLGLQRMISLGAEPDKMVCVIHPHICSKCYEVKEDVSMLFPDSSVVKLKDGQRLDLSGFAESILREREIEKFIVSRLCTHHNPGIFHSYRRDKENAGRIFSWSMIE
ncbi:polyphenol oxidase family protein [candidate division WOR-3 bacterium]|nr:polyphenol oxidase family protein [candidate division WOR-3 bacterium]